MDILKLTDIIVAAKAATYVGGGRRGASSRSGSHDLVWSDAEWSYRDSYFGGTDFIGQEVVWFRDEPVWAMNYYGYILRPDLIDGKRAGATITAALSELYREGRFLGGFRWTGKYGLYIDRSDGDASHFRGKEVIVIKEVEAYALDYFGGLVKS